MIPSFRAGTSSDDQQAASSLTSPNFFNMMNQEYRRTSHPMNSQRDQHMVYKNVMHGESSDQEMNSSSNSQSFEVDERQSDDGSTYKWMPLKMRLVRKMKNPNPTMRIMKNMNDDQQQQYHRNRMSNDVVRVCSDCNTTRTPLWRSGPQGPKTLCNACGIRQRKARRAAAGGGATAPYPTTGFKIQNKEKSSNFQEIKKKPPNPLGSSKKGKELSFEDFALSLSKNSDFQRVFPKDEEEAAILLMALSSGLICSS